MKLRTKPLFLVLLLAACPQVADAQESHSQGHNSAPNGAEIDAVVTLLEFVLEADESTAVECLDKLSARARSGEISRQQMMALRERLAGKLNVILSGRPGKPLHQSSLILAALWGDGSAAERLRADAQNSQLPDPQRGLAVETLAAIQDAGLLTAAADMLTSNLQSLELRARLLAAMAKYESDDVAGRLLEVYAKLDAELQPKAIGLLLQRPAWSKRVLASIAQGSLKADVLNVNQIRSLLASRNEEVASLAKKQFGSVRSERNPQREEVIQQMRSLLSRQRGNAERGQQVFQRVCGQCHRMNGAGQEVGPDITSNGRASFEQLLSNVFDPSLVIGPAYQAITVITQEGRVITGLLVEDSPQRIAIKIQGGAIENIPRQDVDEVVTSKLSLMPEGLEKQINSEELVDLFALITLDRPPSDPKAQPIPGTPIIQGP